MILISGAQTSIAQDIIEFFRKDEIYAFNAHTGSISNRDFLTDLFKKYRPTLFINCEEYNNIDEAEYWRSVAYDINAFGVKNIAQLCQELSIPLVHLSSSYVFDGLQEKYSEENTPAPQTVYGDSKLLGEQFIKENTQDSLLIRIPDYYSVEQNLLPHSIGYFNADQFYCIAENKIAPLSTKRIAKAVVELLKMEIRGTVHLAPDNSTTTEHFLKEYIKKYKTCNTEKKLHYSIVPLAAQDFHKPAERPANNILDNSLSKKYTDICNLTWEEDLAQCYISGNRD